MVAALDGHDVDWWGRMRIGDGLADFVRPAERVTRALHDQRRRRQHLQVGNAIARALAARRRQRIAERDHTGRLRGVWPLFLVRPEMGCDPTAHRLAADEQPRRHHPDVGRDRKSTRLNSSHANISYAVFCLKKKNKNNPSIYLHYPAADNTLNTHYPTEH